MFIYNSDESIVSRNIYRIKCSKIILQTSHSKAYGLRLVSPNTPYFVWDIPSEGRAPKSPIANDLRYVMFLDVKIFLNTMSLLIIHKLISKFRKLKPKQ